MKDLKQFTNLYQVSKTLRFELWPEGETKKTFEKWVEDMNKTKDAENLFAKDKKIRDAYLVIKPIMDKLHEQFIEESLISDMAKEIDFSKYFEIYADQNKEISDDLEKELRGKIGATYSVGGRFFSSKIHEALKNPENEKDDSESKDNEENEAKEDGKDKKKRNKKPFECLTDAKMLKYLSADAKNLARQNGIGKQTLIKHIDQFKGFWGYLKGYNQSRENYYETDEESSTAVATRIVHENLPTFCSNIMRFEKRREEYLNILHYLKSNNRETKIKNAKGVEVEAKAISETVFQIEHFNKCLSQKQIEKYNSIIGNYNYLINLYNQARRNEKSFNKIDEFEKLFKQIGCGKKKSLFAALIKDKDSELTEDEKKMEGILTVEQLLNKAKEAGDRMFKNGDSENIEINSVPALIKFLKECDNWEGIYMSKTAIRKISNLYFANWHSIEDRLISWYKGEKKEQKKKAKTCITYEEKREEPLKLRDAVELSVFFEALDEEESEHFFKGSLFKDDETNDYRDVLDKTLAPSKNLINLLCSDIERNIKAFIESSGKIVKLEKYKDENIQTGEEDENIKQIKKWFDAATDIMRIVRYFAVRKSKMKGNIPNVTMEQALSNLLYSDNAQWFKWYDLVRNYLTKKPQDDAKENKLKLNFDNSTLMDGWDMNKEQANTTVIMRKDGMYYLGIMNPKYNHVFDIENTISNGECYEKMEYKQIALSTGVGGFVRKCFGTAQECGWHCPDNCLNGEGKICIKDDEAQSNLKDIIDCYKSFFDNYEKDGFKYKNFNFCFLESDKYEKLSDFFRDVEWQSYMIKFRGISVSYINDLVKSGKLYLFKIYNKDFSIGKDGGNGSTGKPNMHTIYWKMLFNEGNLKDVVYKLNGQSEVFMRSPVAEKAPITHSVGSKLVNKRDIDGNTIPEKIYREIYAYENAKDGEMKISEEAQKYIDGESVVIKDVKHEITKDKRFYGETKYMFHCPITINFKAKKYDKPQYALPEVNAIITDALQKSENLQFIGIDRGEKHLVYSCTIDKDGKIIEGKCHHHDIISVITKDKDGKDVEHKTDYVQKLEAVADERIIAKQNWQQQSRIKDLKSGYISHVVHRLVEETIKDGDKIAPHAYIVLEDLSTEMKRGRQKIEKQVYQNIELAIAKKLNYVVDKNAKQGELGSASKALQLTPPVSNYLDIEGKKQFGVMLYTRANYTSITDPATGWRKTIYIKNGKDEDIKSQILEKFTDIGFDGTDYYFDYTEGHAGQPWRLYSGKDGKPLPRFQNNKEKQKDKYVWVPEPVNVVEILEELFADFDKAKSFKTQIEDGVKLRKTDKRNETAWQSLRYVLNVIQQIRNSGKELKDDNFLYSPVRNENGEHFDTRNHEKNGELKQIVDADANGAYNIARKGLIMDAHIKYWINSGRPKKSDKKDKKESDLDLFISDREWDLWLLDKNQWEKELPIFASRRAKEDEKKSKSGKNQKRKR